MTALSGACGRLTAALPAAWHLTAQPDADGTRGTT